MASLREAKSNCLTWDETGWMYRAIDTPEDICGWHFAPAHLKFHPVVRRRHRSVYLHFDHGIDGGLFRLLVVDHRSLADSG